MNTQSPLVPQGSLMEQKNKGRARVRIAVFVVLAIHGIGLLALLMQGCKKEPEPLPPAPEETVTNVPPVFAEPTNVPPPIETNVMTAPPTNVPEMVAPPTMVPPPTIAAQQYKIVAGDNFSTLAKKFNVTTKAIVDANPGVDPTKLQIGQTITIPPPSAPVPNGGAPTLTAPAGAGGMQVYSVKSGDTLTSIAAQFRVSLKALRAANPNLPTDRIKVGDKINIPPKAPTAPPAPAPTTPTGQ